MSDHCLRLIACHARLREKKDGPGVTDTEIKIGQTMPSSGPTSYFGTTGRTASAYYRMINDQGGVNARRITFLSLDNEYSPLKSAELARRLVEQDQVVGTFGSLGTPPNVAMQRYLNEHKVPQFFFSGVTRLRDPKICARTRSNRQAQRIWL